MTMSRAQHYAEAERLLVAAATLNGDAVKKMAANPDGATATDALIVQAAMNGMVATAQVHATLAQAAPGIVGQAQAEALRE